MLVEWGVKRADELGIEAFVEATEEGKGLYAKWGFGVVEDVRIRGERWGVEGEVQWIVMRRGKGGID